VICGPCLHIFRPIWITFSAEDVDKNLLSDCELRVNGRSESRSLFSRLDEFLHAKYPSLVKFFLRIRHIMLLIICEFRENRCNEGRTFHTGVSVNRIQVTVGGIRERE